MACTLLQTNFINGLPHLFPPMQLLGGTPSLSLDALDHTIWYHTLTIPINTSNSRGIFKYKCNIMLFSALHNVNLIFTIEYIYNQDQYSHGRAFTALKKENLRLQAANAAEAYNMVKKEPKNLANTFDQMKLVNPSQSIRKKSTIQPATSLQIWQEVSYCTLTDQL